MENQFEIKYQCRCGNEWTPKVQEPKACPSCNRRKWMKSKFENEVWRFVQTYDDGAHRKFLCVTDGFTCFVRMSNDLFNSDREVVTDLTDRANYKKENRREER